MFAEVAERLGVSRPTLYQHVPDKATAFSQVADRFMDAALSKAQAARDQLGSPAERVCDVFATKLQIGVQIWRDSPRHGADILNSALITEAVRTYEGHLVEVAETVLREYLDNDTARKIATVSLALTRGLELSLSDRLKTDAFQELRFGITSLIAGTGAPSRTNSNA